MSSLREVTVGTLTREVRGPRTRTAARSYELDRDLVVLALLILLAAALRFWRLSHQGFWFDEANTAAEVHFTPGQMLTLLKHYESTPPLYYAVAWVWAHIFGFGEAGLRSLSAVCGVLTVPLAYGLGEKFISRRAGLIAAAITACNPLLIWYSQEARAYELVVLLTGIALLAFGHARERPTPRAVSVWAAASALALATEYYSLLVVLPTALWLLYEHPRVRAVKVGLAALAIWSIPLLWFAISQNATRHAGWIAPIPLGPRVGQIFPQFAIGFEAPAAAALAGVDMAIALVALGLLSRRAGLPEKPGARVLGGLVLAGILINALLIVVGIDNLLTRNVISLWLPLAVLVAAGLAVRPRGRRFVSIAAPMLAAVLCLTGIAAAIGVAVHRSYQRPDWRGAVRVIRSRPAPGVGTRAILAQRYRDLLPLSLYMPGVRVWHHHGTDKYSIYTGSYRVSEIDVIAISAPPAPRTGCWWGSACNLKPSRLQASYAFPGFHPVWIRRAYQFTIVRLVASQPVLLTPQVISSALTNTNLIYDDLLVQSST